MEGILVFIFGIFGGILRYLISLCFNQSNFGIQTILVNLIGCFILGFLTTVIQTKISTKFMAAITTGLIGSFTTFSTFTKESILMLINHQIINFMSYTLISILGGLLMAYIGIYIATNYNTRKENS